MDGHKGEQHEARDGQVQDADALALHQGQLHVPGSLQAHEDVEQHGQEDVLLNDVGWKAKARPVQTHVEVAVAVEVIRAWTTYSSSKTIAASFRVHECLGTSVPFRQGTHWEPYYTVARNTTIILTTSYMGGCQNYVFLEPYYSTAPNI